MMSAVFSVVVTAVGMHLLLLVAVVMVVVVVVRS